MPDLPTDAAAANAAAAALPDHVVAAGAADAAADADTVRRATVRGLYRDVLAREADPAGLAHWCAALAAGADAGALLAALTASAEYAQARARDAQTQARDARRARAKLAIAAYAADALAAAPLTIVDVGAQELEGEQHVYAALGAHGLPNHVIGFEPLEDKLRERAQLDGRGTIRLYPNFIGDGGRHLFHINAPDATSSLLPFNAALNAGLVELSHLRTVRTVEVATSRLDDVLADSAEVDFLKLDIQGFELAALQHAGAVLARTNVVHCEVSFAPIYAGQPLFSEVEMLLRGAGFDFIDFSSSCHYAYHGAAGDVAARDRLGWGDALFLRRDAGPRALLAQLVVTLLVYDKYSLAESLAARYDALCGTALAALFLEAAP